MIEDLHLIGRNKKFFSKDIEYISKDLNEEIAQSSFLVLGGAGSIGQAVVKEILSRSPQKLHVIDISENNLVELTRDIRNSFKPINTELEFFPLDIGSLYYDRYIQSQGGFDYVINLSALKHVRSEKDIFSISRMIEVNLKNTIKTVEQSISGGCKKYFCVSTDKAANPINLMGATKRLMELFIFEYGDKINISSARFANVAFSDGSLLSAFQNRLKKFQPLAAPNDIKRYFVSHQEAGELCLMSAIFGNNKEIFFPKMDRCKDLESFTNIGKRFLIESGYVPVIFYDETEAMNFLKSNADNNEWPLLITSSDTTGEKSFEEFFAENESIEMERFVDIGVIKSKTKYSSRYLKEAKKEIFEFLDNGNLDKSGLVDLFKKILPEFCHLETGKYLDKKV